MPNHVHLVCVPEQPLSLARTLGQAHRDFARHFNIVRQTCGHVWQARFFSCPLDGIHLWRAVAYVERNPVRAGLVREAGQYRWSSAAAHLTGMPDPKGLLDLGPWAQEYTPERWRMVLASSVAEEALAERLREATLRGRPLGSEEFIDELERKTGRQLRPLPAGRPKKPRTESAAAGADGRQLPLEIRK